MQKNTPCLWFDGRAEEAMNFYASIFKDFKMVNRAPGPGGSILAVTFQLLGQEFMGLNGGPMFQFTPAISFFVKCQSQTEIDNYWDKLSQGGQTQQCGWLKDKFGVSWQIVPIALGDMLSDADAKKSSRVMQALMKMHKLDIAKLREAYEAA